MNRSKKNYTYLLHSLTAKKIDDIVEIMKTKNEIDEKGRSYSKNTAVTEAIDYYYNTVVNNNPSFFVRIADSIMTTALQKYFKLFSDSINQILVEQNRQKALNEQIARKLEINIEETYSIADKAILEDVGDSEYGE